MTHRIWALALLVGATLFTVLPADAQLFLKQSTASQTRSIGPFLDPADGTAENALTVSAADVRIKINGPGD